MRDYSGSAAGLLALSHGLQSQESQRSMQEPKGPSSIHIPTEGRGYPLTASWEEERGSAESMAQKIHVLGGLKLRAQWVTERKMQREAITISAKGVEAKRAQSTILKSLGGGRQRETHTRPPWCGYRCASLRARTKLQ
jgi:hypothetical protein